MKQKLLLFAAMMTLLAIPSRALTIDANHMYQQPSCQSQSTDDDPPTDDLYSITVNNNGGYVHHYSTMAEALAYGYLNFFCNVPGDSVFSGLDGDTLILRIITFDPLSCNRFHVDGNHCRLSSVLVDGVAIDLYSIANTDTYSLDFSDMWSYAHGARVYTLSVKFNSVHSVAINFAQYFDNNECISLQRLTIDNVTATTADLSWLAGSGTHTYHVLCGLYDDFDGETATFNGPVDEHITTSYDTMISYQLTGLQPNTHYVAYVQMNCDNGGWWYWWTGFNTADGQAGVADIDIDDGIRILVSDGRIIVEGAEGETLQLFDTTGRLLAERHADNSGLNVPAGIYLIKVGDRKAHKMVVL